MAPNDLTAPFAGGCACGAIRYVCAQAPVAMLNCHCLDCQRSSGAPFASGVVVAASAVQVAGTPTKHTVQSGSGRLATRSFCGACGTPLLTSSGTNPEFISIRFASLDDSAKFRPMLDIWTASAQPWACLDPAIPHYAQSP